MTADLSIEDYADWAKRLRRPWRSVAELEERAYLGLGLAGEAGEVADAIKKSLRDGTWQSEAIAEQLGDVAYYWVLLCLAAGRRPGEVLAASRRKIEARLAVDSPDPSV